MQARRAWNSAVFPTMVRGQAEAIIALVRWLVKNVNIQVQCCVICSWFSVVTEKEGVGRCQGNLGRFCALVTLQ